MTQTQEQQIKEQAASVNYISDVKGKRPKAKGKIKIPTYDELPKVRGIFKNLECAGGIHEFPYKAWKGPVKNFMLIDGGEYVIPRVVADHINDNCYYKKDKWIVNGVISTARPVFIEGKGLQGIGQSATKEIASKTHRFLFQILGDA